jgi:RNA polymerase sigma-70 factor (ECF subfamily)
MKYPPDSETAIPRRFTHHRQIRGSSMERGAMSTSFQPMLYLASLETPESRLQFHSFDEDYVARLRRGDPAAQDHFVSYFTALLHIKLRSRLNSPHAIEDVRQETFARVFTLLRKEGALRRPEALGAFLNTVCNNVLLEHYRQSGRSESLDEEGRPEPPAPDHDLVGTIAAQQLKVKVREILENMLPKERSLLKAVFLEEKDRDEVCREFGVDREYLRVLLFRAKQAFKTEYLKRAGAPFAAEKA